MTDRSDELARNYSAEASDEHQERGLRLIALPLISLPTGCDPAQSSGIYVASPLGGYETRLFLEKPVRLASRASTPPITTEVLLGRTMYAA